MEEKFRMKIFMENKAKIARHNQRAHKGDKTYFLKMNHFGDQVFNCSHRLKVIVILLKLVIIFSELKYPSF